MESGHEAVKGVARVTGDALQKPPLNGPAEAWPLVVDAEPEPGATPGDRRRTLGTIASVVAVVVALGGLWLLNRGDEPDGTPAPGVASSFNPSPSPRAESAQSGEVDRPGPDNTGVPAGTTLTPHDDLTVTEDDTVIDALDIKGCVYIQAQRVTIKRSKITCPEQMVTMGADSSLVLEDSELDGARTGFAIGYDNYTLRRVNIHNINEGPRLGTNVVIEDSWIHDLVFTNAEDHQDVMQTTGGGPIVVQYNTIDAVSRDRDVLFNAAIMVGAEQFPLSDMTVTGNLLGGGGYTVNIREDPEISRVVFRDNVFRRDAEYGAVRGPDTPGVDWDDSNVWLDTRAPVTRD